MELTMKSDHTLEALRSLYTEYEEKAGQENVPDDAFPISKLVEIWDCGDDKARKRAKQMVKDGRMEVIKGTCNKLYFRLIPSQ